MENTYKNIKQVKMKINDRSTLNFHSSVLSIEKVMNTSEFGFERDSHRHISNQEIIGK